MDKLLTPVGFDLGNTEADIYLLGKSAKISSRIAFELPPGAISQKTGQELKAKAFSLLFTQLVNKKEITVERWFGQDVLGAGAIQKLDMAKYDANHITVLFRAALYQWGEVHHMDLATLGKLNIVASMPPGLFKDTASFRKADLAFRKAFNRRQSHLKIRDSDKSIQIVTQFQEVIREAVAFGQDVFRDGDHILTVDIGGFTNDYALFNGAYEPVWTKSDNNGLLTAYADVDTLNPAQAELKILRTKKAGLPHQLTSFYNEVERKIQLITLRWPHPIKKIYIIGGGAALMTPSIKASFSPLADKVIFKNEYANCEANWRKAGGK